MEGTTKLLKQLAQTAEKEIAKIKAERAKLEKEKDEFEQMKAKIATVHFPNKIDLNIGGTIFSAPLETLRKEEDSMLAAMFSGKGFEVKPDERGAYFIDRDGTHVLLHHQCHYNASNKASFVIS